jgi:hypothetical protein
MNEQMLPFELIQTGKPILQGLNSYYIDIHKLIEHYQGNLGSGGLSFQSPRASGVLFFDKDEMINGYYQENGNCSEGIEVIDLITDLSHQYNFSIDVYKIEPELVYYWSNIHSSQIVYDNLSSEFTDLGGLIRKLAKEKFTGYIDIQLASKDTYNAVFFLKGKIISHCDTENNDANGFSKGNIEALIQKTTELGGCFKVYQILTVKASSAQDASKAISAGVSDISSNIEKLLNEVSDYMDTNLKKAKVRFCTLLKKKSIEKADQYPFLDPFAAEFEYTDRTVSVNGNINGPVLIAGIIDVLKAIANDVEMQPEISGIISLWSQKTLNLKELRR